MDNKLQFSHTFFETTDYTLEPSTTSTAIEAYTNYWQWLQQTTLGDKYPLFSIPNLQTHLHLMDQILPALVQINCNVIGGFQSSAKGAKTWFKLYEDAEGWERIHMLKIEKQFGISFEALSAEHMEKLEALERELEVLMEINNSVERLKLVKKILEHVKKPVREAVKGLIVGKDDSKLLVGR